MLIIDDAEGRRTISLEAATYSIGRDTTNSVVLHSKMVSRQHALLLRVTAPDSFAYLFRIVDGDLQGKRSTNGMIVNGRRLFSHDLKHGDVIIFGGDVKAKYYAVSDLSDADFDRFCEASDLSTILSNSVNPFQTLVPTDDALQSMSEASLVRLASFPELTPNPILEIDLCGTVTYLNPSAVLNFPDLEELGLNHPMLEGLLSMIQSGTSVHAHKSFFAREVEIGEKVFEQSVHYIHESDLVRSYVIDITERKRAEEQLRHQAQREAIINRIVQAMRVTMVTAEVLNTTVSLMVEALGATHCIIVQMSAEGELTNQYCSEGASGREDLLQGNTAFLRYCQAQLQAGQQVVLADMDSAMDLDVAAIARHCGLQALMMTPLIYLQTYLGSISLYQSESNARGWSEDDLELVRTIANQCAIAIHQAQLYQRVQDLNADLEQQVQDRTAQLRQKMKELERLNSLKDDFLSTVSHELRTPMSNIKMAIHMLGQFPLGEKQQRYLKILAVECDRETELINDLLDLQRLEAGGNPVTVERLLLQDWLPGVLEPFRARLKDRQQHLEVSYDSEVVAIETSRVSLERVLAELLNNACKYTAKGGKVHFEVQGIMQPEPRICFRVTNQAEIASHELPRIFDKFYRVPHADPWKQGGTGLGLALVKKLVEQLSGEISVDSSDGATTFIVSMPPLMPTAPALY
nr:ATP-binding protein [Petrachloros mirabilis]